MKHLFIKTSLLLILTFLSNETVAQTRSEEISNSTNIFLNELEPDEKVILREKILIVSLRSNREENLKIQLLKSNHILKVLNVALKYGMNEIEIPVGDLLNVQSEGGVFTLQYFSTYFGNGNFNFQLETPIIPTDPIANIQIDPSHVNCEENELSSIDFFGQVNGGTAPYKVTWLISKGPFIKDLINKPLDFELTSDSEISKIVVAEKLDFYVTFLVEDACGHNDKKVVHLKCRKDEEDGMLYFQPIEIFDRFKKSQL